MFCALLFTSSLLPSAPSLSATQLYSVRAPSPQCSLFPKKIVFAPSKTLDENSVKLAQLLEAEIESTLNEHARKQVKLQNAQESMDQYVGSPMLEEAERLEEWAELVQSNLDQIPHDAVSFIHEEEDGNLILLQFGHTPGTYTTPAEEAEVAASMAQKLYKQQQKIDNLAHRNDGVAQSLLGWQKRVRLAAARGEAEALHALRKKILASSKRLGVRTARLKAFVVDDELDI